MSQAVYYRVGLLEWQAEDGITEMILDELVALGHHPVLFEYGAPIPADVDVVLSHGPHGELLPVWQEGSHVMVMKLETEREGQEFSGRTEDADGVERSVGRAEA